MVCCCEEWCGVTWCVVKDSETNTRTLWCDYYVKCRCDYYSVMWWATVRCFVMRCYVSWPFLVLVWCSLTPRDVMWLVFCRGEVWCDVTWFIVVRWCHAVMLCDMILKWQYSLHYFYQGNEQNRHQRTWIFWLFIRPLKYITPSLCNGLYSSVWNI